MADASTQMERERGFGVWGWLTGEGDGVQGWLMAEERPRVFVLLRIGAVVKRAGGGGGQRKGGREVQVGWPVHASRRRSKSHRPHVSLRCVRMAIGEVVLRRWVLCWDECDDGG